MWQAHMFLNIDQAFPILETSFSYFDQHTSEVDTKKVNVNVYVGY